MVSILAGEGGRMKFPSKMGMGWMFVGMIMVVVIGIR